MSKNVKYVIMERGYEYNDEIYQCQDFDSGTPTKIYSNRIDAERDCLKYNVEWIRNEDLSDYSYSNNNIDTEKAKQMSDDHLVSAILLLNIYPKYYVVEVSEVC